MIAENKNWKLQGGQVQVWKIHREDWQGHSQKLNKLLSREEHQRLSRFKIPEKQAEFILSRGILRLILASYLGAEPASVPIRIDPRGKPYLESSEIEFNLSHSKNILLVGLNLANPLGIDVQEVYKITNLQTILRNHFSIREQEFLTSVPEARYLEEFFSLWSAKEAYLKALGAGFQEASKDLNILPLEADSEYYRVEGKTSRLVAGSWTIQSLKISKGYQAALAVLGAVNEILITPFVPDGQRLS